MFPQRYSAKLVVYTILLMLLLTGSLLYTYSYVYSLLVEENNSHLANMSQILQSRIEADKKELQRYTDIVADDLRIKEYMFAVVDIGTEPVPLQQIYQRQFGWLPIENYMIMDRDRNVLAGTTNPNLTRLIQTNQHEPLRGTAYLLDEKGLILVAFSPIEYRGSYLGTITTSYRMNAQWLQNHKYGADGQIFLVQDTQIVDSSLPRFRGERFLVRNRQVHLAGQIFRVHPLHLTATIGGVPQVWFAMPETSLVLRLKQHRLTTIIVVSASLLVLVLFGLVIMRNFSRPLDRLMELTQEVSQGRLPVLDKSAKKDEIAELSNRFADMLQALREKQREVDLAHAELEKTAITDSLTGLYNRRQLGEVFPKLLAQAQRTDQMLFAILMDLDKFKHINDTHGHLCGDTVLEHFSTRLFEVSRANDYLFRMGGEEFLLLTVNNDASGIIALAEKVRLTMEQTHVECDDHDVTFTISSGISIAALDEAADVSLRNMLSRADAALYQAKKTGRNQVQVDAQLAA
jgi:diguanylate cyclase (GGDEF)-like protein